ncbi:MAG TPA: neutral zinc metallopeptidase [Acidimicrobiia bacterium]|nr:neutral zinc metallopeptidase [Acidimicrobiia bacterium]
MRWKPGRRSTNIEDRRGQGPARGGRLGGLPFPINFPTGGKGCLGLGGGTLGIVVAVALLLLNGGDVLSGGGSGSGGFPVGPDVELPRTPSAQGEPLPGAPDPDGELVDYMSFVLDDVQATWREEFTRADARYEDATLVLFTGAVDSGCGFAQAASGPFYCPLDSKVYLDLDFFRELRDRFDAPGDFAQAYVLAHEIGHHVQNVLGINADVRRQQQREPDDANELSVRQELQADCYAGIWAHSTFERDLLEKGDVEEGLAAAAAVGDDRIQRETTGRVDPESFTHGTSKQRQHWFDRGFSSGDTDRCDTFAVDRV